MGEAVVLGIVLVLLAGVAGLLVREQRRFHADRGRDPPPS